MEKLYAERDHMAQDRAGNYYCRHASAMTGEGLHSKSDIAGELAHRDILIDTAQRRIERLEEALRDAATSLRTIADKAGKDEYLDDMLQVRGYANSRANVADAALQEAE